MAIAKKPQDNADIKPSQDFIPVYVCDPTSALPRVMQAYSQEELDKFIIGGWSIES